MNCDGSGHLDCYCGGDHCACGFPPECPGCDECAPEPDPEVRVAQLEGELESLRGLSREACLKLCGLYDGRLSDLGVISERCDPAALVGVSRLRHLRWMLSEMRNMQDAGKINRWLGFIQGALWWGGVFTVDQLRAHVIGVSR